MSGPLLLPTWADLEATTPAVVVTMRRYLEQIACVLRPGSVNGADLALRSFTTFLAQQEPRVDSIAQVSRRHVEDYKPWLAARPGQTRDRAPTGHHRPPARDAADVLHQDPGVGLGAGPDPGTHVPW